MNRRLSLAAIVLTLIVAMLAAPAVGGAKKAKKYADTILTNARVYTVDEAQPWAKVVAVRGEKIVYVGGDKGKAWRKYVGPETNVINVKQRLVLPGMVDSHTHPASVAMSSWHIALPWTYDLETILSFVQQYAAAHPVSEAPFIYAEYYPSDMYWGPDGPTAAAIDAYVSDRPVLLQDFSDHSATINSKMLELLEVNENTPLQPNPDDPAQQFVRYPGGTTPTGHVLEGAWRLFADNMWSAIGWSPPSDVTPELLSNFTGFLSSKGEVAVWDAGGGEATFAAAKALDEQGMLNMYYYGSKRFWTVEDLPEHIAVLRDWQQKYGSRHIKLDAMKFFLDGTNEIGTSAVLEPFLFPPATVEDDLGVLRMSEDDLVTSMLMLNEEGIDLHIHLVGDRAFRVACNAVERAQNQVRKAWRAKHAKRSCRQDPWRLQVTLAHNELIDPADMPRVGKLGIILNWTPHWSGGYFSTQAADWLGWIASIACTSSIRSSRAAGS